MTPYLYAGARGNLIRQQKNGWQQGLTGAARYFVHGTALTPSEVHRGGISPDHSTEYLVDENDAAIAGGRMIFTFPVCAGAGLPANASTSPAVGQLWGFNGHCYVFLVPIGTTYWSRGGTLGNAQEVAFPYEFASGDIYQYWAPSNNFVNHGGGGGSPRTNFQKVPWNAYLASRVAALAAI